MAGLNDFHWLRPEWLLAIVPVLILLGLLWRSHYQGQQWHKYINAALLPTLLQGGTSRKSRAVLVAIAVCWLAACVAMAGPVWQKQPMPVVQNTEALVIAWDLSPSMLAKDITPSRLDRARLKIIDLLKTRADGQTALIAYSGEAYTVTPLTDDIQTIINLLPALAPTTLPSVGSNPEMAFTQANELLKQAGVSHGHILMLTDEITPEAMDNMSGPIKNSPHQLTLWGIGTTEGAPIPLPKGGFAKDGTGAIAVAKLNEVELQHFASQMGSYYVPVVTDNSDITTLQSLLVTPKTKENTQATDRLFDQWLEQGYWLIWLCLPLLAFGFRRGWLMVALVAMPQLMLPKTAEASPLDHAFSTPDQTANKAYQNQDYEQAAKTFEQPDWQGAALYRKGDYAEAAKAFAKDDSAQSDYNRGNAELLANNLDNAIKAYDEALKKQPDFAEAKKNSELAKAIKKQQEEQKKQDQDKQGQNKDQDQDQNKDQDQKDQNQDDQQNQDQDQKDQDKKDQQQKQDQKTNDQKQDEKNQQAQKDQQSGSSSQGSTSSTQAQGQDQSSSQASSQSAEQAGEMASSSATSDEEKEQQAQALAQDAQEPLTEEQQKLEQALRKVPDDPAGLLREKFRYQYRERQQSLGGGYDQTGQAEQRW
ncbi:MAG: VWA domain-containing protein [Marinagarivorans sp.]|nr:VWA domain-containing protein [Marinagarivorans sp.]